MYKEQFSNIPVSINNIVNSKILYQLLLFVHLTYVIYNLLFENKYREKFPHDTENF